jgi:RHS repeat-associated protein
VIRKTQVTGNQTLVLAMGYSSADRLISMTYPSGTAVGYGRDSQGRIVSVTINAAPFITNVNYLPFGPISVITFQNGKTLTKTFDQNYDIDTIISTATGGLNLDYTPDEVGNIKTINQSGTTFNLSYDKLYRLKSVKDQNQLLIEGFTYDATGNRLSKQLGTTAAVPYTYASTNHRLTNAGTGVRSFDANGNSTDIPAVGTLAYDERNRLSSGVQVWGTKPNQFLVTDSYLFNARGERVQTSQNGFGPIVFKPFLYDEAGKLLATGTSKVADEVIYLDAIPVARVQNGVILPIETDHLGTPRVIQNATGGGTTWTWNVLANAATGSNAFGEQAASGSDFNLRFPGQYSDGNGLSYNYFRDYEPGTGRYVESDLIGLDGGVSTYSYVDNAPLEMTDPEGLQAMRPIMRPPTMRPLPETNAARRCLSDPSCNPFPAPFPKAFCIEWECCTCITRGFLGLCADVRGCLANGGTQGCYKVDVMLSAPGFSGGDPPDCSCKKWAFPEPEYSSRAGVPPEVCDKIKNKMVRIACYYRSPPIKN